MLGDSYIESMREKFAAQFEPHGSGFVYRKSRFGAPIPVSAEERERFIANYIRQMRYAFWGAVALLILSSFAAVIFEDATGTEISDAATLIHVVIIVGMLGCLIFWAQHGPVRALRGRSAIGEKKSKAEIHHTLMAEQTYAQIALVGLFPIIMFAGVDYEANLARGWNGFRLTVAITATLLFGFVLWRKWRFDRKNK
jgi:hypothetical protein